MRRLSGVVRLVLLVGVSTTAASAQPFIFYRGVVNAASFAPPGLPNGSIARGSIFTIFGRNLGPAQAEQVSAFPLQTTLADVSVEVCKDGACVPTIPLFVSAGQVNAIMPSNAPLGGVSVRVIFNGQAGNFSPAKLVASSLGIFTVSSSGSGPGIVQNFIAQDNQPINSLLSTARPGQALTLWGTGLGAALNADNVAPQVGDLPVDVEIFVGGKQVTRKLYSGRTPCCAGVDQLVFELPADTPVGCYVPVQVRTNRNVASSAVTIAVSEDGEACPEAAAPGVGRLLVGGRFGRVVLFQNSRKHRENGAELDRTGELVQAAFSEERGGPWAFHPAYSPLPLGTCVVSASRGELSAGFLPTVRALDAGEQLSVTASGQIIPVPRDPQAPHTYARGLGLQGPALSIPLLLNPPGPLQIQGSGAQDVGSFSMAVGSAASVEWTNRASIVEVDRAADLTVTWRDIQPPSGRIWIGGGVQDSPTGSIVTFSCAAAPEAGTFTIPSYVLAVLPASRARESHSNGWLAIGGLAKAREAALSTSGIDIGTAVSFVFVSNTVRYR